MSPCPDCGRPDCTATHDNQAPIAKYDGDGQPIRFDDPRLGNRAERRAAARAARRSRR